MNPSPLRTLDPVDPPTQWDDIVARAALGTSAYDRTDDLRDAPPRRRVPALVAAAATAAAVLGAGVALAQTDGGDGSTGLATAPTAAPTVDPAPVAGLTGPCPFTLDGGLSLAPGTDPLRGLMLSFDRSATQGHGELDGVPFTVGVGSFESADHLPLGPPGDPGLSVAYSTLPIEQPTSPDMSTWGPYHGFASPSAGVDGGTGPCDDIVVMVALPLTEDEVSLVNGDPLDASRNAETLDEGYIAQGRPHLDRILAAVRRTG